VELLKRETGSNLVRVPYRGNWHRRQCGEIA
jgi:hypothetical protein